MNIRRFFKLGFYQYQTRSGDYAIPIFVDTNSIFETGKHIFSANFKRGRLPENKYSEVWLLDKNTHKKLRSKVFDDGPICLGALDTLDINYTLVVSNHELK